nr:hypothetical protein [Bordetella pertussis]
MAETFWLALAPAWAGGLVLSWALEALLRPPVQPPWRRPAWMLLLHAGVWTLLFALELALFRRPYFGAINVLAIEAVLVLVSAAKARVLREPFVYSDFEYFTDALRHPRLYLPFLGWPAALLLACGYGLALWAGLALESSATCEDSIGCMHGSSEPDLRNWKSPTPQFTQGARPDEHP